MPGERLVGMMAETVPRQGQGVFMRWRIKGAHAANGEDMVIEVEADDQHGAELAAKNQRVMVSEIEPIMNPEPQGEDELTRAAAEAQQRRVMPYASPKQRPQPTDALRRRAEWADGFGIALIVLCFVGIGLTLLNAVLSVLGDKTPALTLPLEVSIGISAVLGGVGSFLRLAAEYSRRNRTN